MDPVVVVCARVGASFFTRHPRQLDHVRAARLDRVLRNATKVAAAPGPAPVVGLRDLWGTASTTTANKRALGLRSKLQAVPVVPTHGISYRPDARAHTDQVAAATAFEVKRAAEKRKWDDVMRASQEARDAPDDEDGDASLRRWAKVLTGVMKPDAVDPAEEVNRDDGDDDDDDDGSGEVAVRAPCSASCPLTHPSASTRVPVSSRAE